jgi:O-antigen/teichoic acid export membrane protein
LGFLKLEFKKIRHLFKPSLALMIIFIGQNILIQGLTTSIGVVLGSTQVVIFNTTRTLMNMAKQIVNIVNLSFISEFSYAFGVGNHTLLRRLFQKVQATNMGISLISVAGVLIFGQWILDIWTQHRIDVVQPFFVLFGVSVFLNSWWSGGLVLLIATNKQYKTGAYFLFVSIFILGFILLFLERGGLTWIATMLIAFEVLMIFVVFHFCKTSLAVLPWKNFRIKQQKM